jgi:hypothetical protein
VGERQVVLLRQRLQGLQGLEGLGLEGLEGLQRSVDAALGEVTLRPDAIRQATEPIRALVIANSASFSAPCSI